MEAVRVIIGRSGLRPGEWIAGVLIAMQIVVFLFASYVALFVWPHGR